jgi:hypothetical protein
MVIVETAAEKPDADDLKLRHTNQNRMKGRQDYEG